MQLEPKTRRRCLAGMFLFVLSFYFAGFIVFVAAKPAYAITGAPDVVAKLSQQDITKEIKVQKYAWVKASVFSALLNALTFFLQKIAYDTAAWVAAGGEGQEPLFISEGWGAYLSNTALDAAADFIGSFNTAMGFQHFNLCAPNLSIILKIQLGLAAAWQPPAPRCTWNQVSGNWGAFRESWESGEALRNIGVAFEPGQTPLASALEINRKSIPVIAAQEKEAEKMREEGKGFLPVRGIISGNIQTPGAVVEQQMQKKMEYGQDLTRAEVTGAFFNADVGFAIVNTVVSTFVNTLATKLLDRVMGGFFSLADLFDRGDIFDPEFARVGGREAARRIFAELLTVNIQTVDNYDALGEFVTCPPTRGPNNCVLDDQFANAVRQASAGRPITVREAIEQSALHGDWLLIPETEKARNQDQYCYTKAYCYSNLTKLRKARILPIGWELAASSKANKPKPSRTLFDIMSSFDDCNEDNKLDADHPWCHLIDPNWVLKYPRAQCRALVPGASLANESVDTRVEECVDTPSCVSEDTDGNCLGWGYCTREKNTWEFDGDSCPGYFNSCLAFTGPENKQLAVRTNTVDFGICNMENAGCRWYSTAEDFIDTAGEDSNDRVCSGGLNDGQPCDPERGDEDCLGGGFCVVRDMPDTLVWRENASDRVYLNRQAPQCEAQNAGCTEVIPRVLPNDQQITLNLVRNSGFEQNRDTSPDLPDFWVGDVPEISEDGTEAAYGFSAVRLGQVGDEDLFQRFTLQPNKFYTMSISAKRVSETGNPTARFGVYMHQADGNPAPIADFYTTCFKTGTHLYRIDPFTPADAPAATPGAFPYERASCTFTSPSDVAYGVMIVRGRAGGGEGVWIDGIQLEQNEIATPYTDGYSSTATRVHLKVPQSDLCTGDETDPPICDNYAYVCSAQEVGCELYTPVLDNPPITGIARVTDQCPKKCVGYETFREEPTRFNPDGVFPNYFIPDRARSCSASSAGCDEFTNLGTEGREYFTYLRLCEAPNEPDEAGTFYTWEGSENEGFQLRVWLLKVSDVLNAPVSDVDPSRGQAPCTNYDGQFQTCTDAADFTLPDNCSERIDIFSNPDCREFYDEDGKIHYRLFSDTIIKTQDCTDYRQSQVFGQSACHGAGGRWQTATNQCFYRAYTPTSRSCSASENLCRLYTGNAGRNVQVFFEDDFEAMTLDEKWSGGALSNESLATQGHSIRRTDQDMKYNFNEEAAVFKDRTFMLSFWARGSLDTQIGVFFNGASSNPDLRRRFSYIDDEPDTPTTTLAPEWRFYELGPVAVDFNLSVPVQLIITATAADASIFVDNIRLRVVSQNIPIIRDSWDTPAKCDATPEGAYSPQEMLGCASYNDRAGNLLHLRSFSELCRDKAVGCAAFFNTHNSSSSYAESWNYICVNPGGAPVTGLTECFVDPDGGEDRFSPVYACSIPPGHDRCTFKWEGEMVDSIPDDEYSAALPLFYVNGTGPGPVGGYPPGTYSPFFYEPDLTVVPADTTIYLVDTEKARCPAEQTGCQLLGKPTYSQDQSEVTGFGDLALRNLPDQYESILCSHEALFCDAWGTADGSEYYFKDPLDKQCEYKESGPGDTFGWFHKDTDEPCYDNFRIELNENGIWTNRAVCALLDGGDAGTSPACNLVGGCECPGRDDGTGVGSVVQCRVPAGQDSCSPYEGWAGACQTHYSGCTEFWDAADGNKPYDFIKNDRLDEQYTPTTERCDGEVALKEGCVLFNDTSDPILRWNAGATNLKSKVNDYAKVTPVDCENPAGGDAEYCRQCFGDFKPCTKHSDCFLYSIGEWSPCRLTTHENDSNLILKVRRDRECSQWLSCLSSQPVTDPHSGEAKDICQQVALCDEFDSTRSSGCGSWPETEPERLTRARYANRDVSWYGEEYAGSSIPNTYPIEHLSPVNIGKCAAGSGNEDRLAGTGMCASDSDCATDSDTGDTCEPSFVLGLVGGVCTENHHATCTVKHCTGSGATCQTNADCEEITSGSTCTAGSAFNGRCYQHQCARNIRGKGLAGRLTFANSRAETPRCRAYPETNSPFPSGGTEGDGPSVVATWVESYNPAVTRTESRYLHDRPLSFKSGFQNAQVCRGQNDCECTYRKVAYGGGKVQYYAQNPEATTTIAGGAVPPRNVCEGGAQDGRPCVDGVPEGDIASCKIGGNPEGRCVAKERDDTFFGLEGFCLEEDLSRIINADPGSSACLTWWPIDQIPGATDIYGKFAEAGFDIAADTYYCAEPQLTKAIESAGPHCTIAGDNSGVFSDDCDDDHECWGALEDVCPPGYFVYTNGCINEWDYKCGYAFEDECRYQCVPYGSVHTTTETDNPNSGAPDWEAGDPCGPWDLPTNSQAWFTNDRYYNSEVGFAYYNHENGKTPFNDCVKRGVPNNVLLCAGGSNHGESCTSNADCPESADGCVAGYEGTGARVGSLRGNPRPSEFQAEVSCRVVVQTSRGGHTTDTNKAWTDRVWSGTDFDHIVVAGVTSPNPIEYTFDSPPSLYGQSDPVPPGPRPEGPLLIEMCWYEDAGIHYPPDPAGNCIEGGVLTDYEHFPDHLNETRARPYSNIAGRLGEAGAAGCLNDAQCNAGVSCGIACRRPCDDADDCVDDTALCNVNDEGGSVCSNNEPAPCADGWATVSACVGGDLAGLRCDEIEDCYGARCDPFSLTCRGVTGGWTQLPASVIAGTDPAGARGRIQQIFAKAYQFFLWDEQGEDEIVGTQAAGPQGGYKEIPERFDATEVLGLFVGHTPKVFGIGECVGATCELGREDTISVNAQEYGDVPGPGGQLPVVMQFYGFADKNRMPIRNVIVHWGDGGESPGGGNDNYYRNHHPDCDGSEWGRTSESCSDSPFQYVHTYLCNNPGALQPCSGEYNENGCSRGLSCVYKPRVLIKDNWGWCATENGCDGPPGGDGCYDSTYNEDASLSGENECHDIYPNLDFPDRDPWIYFDGEVVISP